MATPTAGVGGRDAAVAATAGAGTDDAATTRRASAPGAIGVRGDRTGPLTAAETAVQDGAAGAATDRPAEDRPQGAAATGDSAAGTTPGAAADPASAASNGATTSPESDAAGGQGPRDAVASLPGEAGDLAPAPTARRDVPAGAGTASAGDDADGAATGTGAVLQSRGTAPDSVSAGAGGLSASTTEPAAAGGADAATSTGVAAGPASSGPVADSASTAATAGTDRAAQDGTTTTVSADAFGPSARPLAFLAGGTGADAERPAVSGASGVDPMADLPTLARAAGSAFDPAAGFAGADVRPGQAAASDTDGVWLRLRAEWLQSGGAGVATDLPGRHGTEALAPDTSVFPS